MTATDELRRLLDERGVEWGNVRNDGSESEYLTEWQFDDDGGIATAVEWAVGGGLSVEIHRYRLTPAQAVAATLVTGTCRMERVEDEERILHGWMECSECGPVYPPAAERIQDAIKYCPFCGRKVVRA